ncbi:MAG: 16S rRNA (cytosine(967)-C(5))-methyltransferase RsmB [Bacillota bacterium]|nr:16S rRNA (cytosine(967)-C(5))-methyltransferase RsmB [Bacillota bacterium]
MENTRNLAAKILHAVTEEGAYANLTLSRYLNQCGLERRDKAFVTSLVYGTLEHLCPINYQLNQFLKKPLKKKDRFLMTLLRLGFYEILYTDTPGRAVVNEIVKLAKKHGHQGWGNMANGILRNLLRQKEMLAWPKFSTPLKKIVFESSLPQWLGDLWQRERGEGEAVRLLESVQEVRSLVLRVNTLVVNRGTLQKDLEQEGCYTEPCRYSPHGLRFLYGENPLTTSCYQNGFFTIQEESSQMAALALSPGPGQKVLDLCAAPGGKTTHLAQLMKNQGAIMAGDIHPHKIKLIEENARRLSINIIEAETRDGKLWGEEFPGFFDCVLLDAPCSGLGVLSRRQDARFRKDASDIVALAAVQWDLICSAVKALKPGGVMVYSTCTLTNLENHENRRKLLESFSEIKPLNLSERLQNFSQEEAPFLQEGYLELLPYRHHTDGFYISAYRKEPS